MEYSTARPKIPAKNVAENPEVFRDSAREKVLLFTQKKTAINRLQS